MGSALVSAAFFITHRRLGITYRDLRDVPDLADKTILAIKAPPDTVLNCDVQEVSRDFVVSHRMETKC